MSYIIRAINQNKSARIFIADTTQMVQKIREIHESSATASAAMGRLATISSIMGIASLNDNETVSITFDGKGIGGKLRSVAKYDGFVKVTVENPLADPDSKYPGKLDVSSFVGTAGNISVVKDLNMKEPYVGISEIITGEIAEDMTNYFYYSEQTPSIVSLGVLVDRDLSIKSAGGIFVQVLPDISEEEISELEKIASNLPPISELIDNGNSPEMILEKYFSKLSPEILEKKDVDLYCDCSHERIKIGLESIGKVELKKLLEEDKKVEVICEFCKTKYTFDEIDLQEMIINAR